MMDRVRCGVVEVEAFVDALIRWPLSNTFPDARPADLGSVRLHYPQAFEGEFWLLPVHCYLARTPERVVLFDAGLGASVHSHDRYGSAGVLLQRLAKRGLRPDEVTDVVFTHMHGDHMGGALVERGGNWAPAFAAARHHVHAADWDLLVERSAQGGMSEHLLALERLTDLHLFDGEVDLGRGVRILHTPGHTPGSVCAVLGDAA